MLGEPSAADQANLLRLPYSSLFAPADVAADSTCVIVQRARK